VSMLLRWLLLSCLTIVARAQEPKLVVPDSPFAAYDLSALKAGEWVEYRDRHGRLPVEEHPEHVRLERWACVEATPAFVVVEVTALRLAGGGGGEDVLAYELERATGRIRRAWQGKAGVQGVEFGLDHHEVPDDEPVRGELVVAPEAIEHLGRRWDADHIVETLERGEGPDAQTTTTRAWYSPDVPFRLREPDVLVRGLVRKGERARPGGLLRREVRCEGPRAYRSSTELTALGTDARSTLARPK